MGTLCTPWTEKTWRTKRRRKKEERLRKKIRERIYTKTHYFMKISDDDGTKIKQKKLNKFRSVRLELSVETENVGCENENATRDCRFLAVEKWAFDVCVCWVFACIGAHRAADKPPYTQHYSHSRVQLYNVQRTHKTIISRLLIKCVCVRAYVCDCVVCCGADTVLWLWSPNSNPKVEKKKKWKK